jgi:hypothetical protein
MEFIHEGDLNLYVYPGIADYVRSAPLPPTWHRLESSVREIDEKSELSPVPAGRPADSALFNFSLGSADVSLMRRVISALADTKHRYIVSKGPLHAEIELAPNMWGPSSSRRPRSSRWPTWSSRVAATTRRPSRCTSASR